MTEQDKDGPGNAKEISGFMHCSLCLDDRPPEESPETWARLSVGWTKRGLQVWCVRHDANVLHVDFEGVQHKANTTRDASDE